MTDDTLSLPVGESAASAAAQGRWQPLSERTHSVLTVGLRLPLLMPPAAILSGHARAPMASSSRAAARAAWLGSSRSPELWREVRARTRRLAALPQDHQQQLTAQLDELLSERMIEPVPPAARYTGLYSDIFLVRQPKPDGTVKARVIFDLRYLNQMLKVDTFRMETLARVSEHLHQGMFMAVLDIKHAFGHIPVAPSHRQLLRFVDHRGLHFQYRTAPFGLACSPIEWTRLLRAPVNQLRREGIRLFMYMDDIIVLATSEQLCHQHLARTAQLLSDLGIRISPTKTQLPAQKVVYLGFEIDSRDMTLAVPLHKLEQVTRACTAFLRLPPSRTTLREALRLLGRVRSLQAVAPSVIPATRQLSAWASARMADRRLLSLSAQTQWFDHATGPWPTTVRDEINALLLFARAAVAQTRSQQRSTWRQPIVPDIDLAHLNKQLAVAGWSVARIESDASRTGWGATAAFYPASRPTISTPSAQTSTAGYWPPSPASAHDPSIPTVDSSINVKELHAAIASASALLPLVATPALRATTLVVFATDNTTARSYLARKCGRFRHLTAIAQTLTTWARTNGFDPSLMLSHHLPGIANTTADELSRLDWRHEIQLHPQLFTTTVQALGAEPPQLDLFASDTCRQPACPQWTTRWPAPQLRGAARTSHMDALHPRLNWSSLPPTWAFPPTPLVPRVLRRLNITPPTRDFILVVPWWPGAAWWPLLTSLTSLRALQQISTASLPSGQSALRSVAPQTDSAPPAMLRHQFGAALLRA